MDSQRTRKKRLILVLGVVLIILIPITLQLPYGPLDWTVQAQPYATPTLAPPPATTAPGPGCAAPPRTLLPEREDLAVISDSST